jgi:hypothetical protein
MFGTKAPGRLPTLTYFLFFLRDTMTVGASFNAPTYFSDQAQQQFGLSKRRADFSAQLFTPCLVQLLSTPIHLTGLDLYNRPSVTLFQRFQFVRGEYIKSVTARMARILPAFGFGGVGNSRIRTMGRQYLAGHPIKSTI